jgi:hypothetical protein
MALEPATQQNLSPTVHCPPSIANCPILVGLGGLEPPTSRLSSARSNQLSYKPKDQETDQKSRPGFSPARRLCPTERETKTAGPANAAHDLGR